MVKNIIKYFGYLIAILVIIVMYLSYFGIETKQFNELIKDRVEQTNQNIDIELNKVKILLNPISLNISLETLETKILFENKKINLKKVEINFSIKSFLTKQFAIESLKISTKENSVKNIISLIRLYKNTPQTFIFSKILKKGNFDAKININFDDKGKIKDDYEIRGKADQVTLSLLNKNSINKINLEFEIYKNKYVFKEIESNFKELKIFSNKIQIENKASHYFVKGDLNNSLDTIKDELFVFFFKKNLKENIIKEATLSTQNKFSFKLSKKIKVSDINVKSKIKLKKIIYEKKHEFLNDFLPTYQNKIELEDHDVELSYEKNSLILKGKGKIFIDNKFDKISYNINYKENNYNFESVIQLNNFPLEIKSLDYKKKKGVDANLELKGLFKKNDFLIFKKILFKENENLISINGLKLDKNSKIKDIKSLKLNYININNKKNKISLSKSKKSYKIKGRSFDGNRLLNELLNGDSKNDNSKIFTNLNADILISIDQIYTDNKHYIKNLNGKFKFIKNNLVSSNLEGNFNNNKKITFKVYKNSKNEKITTLYSEFAEPLVKKYKFIKGFEEGILDFVSIKKNGESTSQLKIYDFKLQELPALTKILTLASLQGIADLLTGEGIRFNEFEMNFKNKNTLMTIDEIYAIGPAISVLMSGYVEEKKLISLRGTLVPAITLNKVVGSIPFLGNILVGSKTGEGVFGVSFKIKGPPKNLRTTVNPIKTLTPRFITRTLEKIKKESK